MPSKDSLLGRILYSTNISRGECRNKDEALLLRYFGFAEPNLILYKYSNYNPFPDFINKKIKENYTDKTTAQPQTLRLSGHTDRVIDPCCLKNHGFLFSHLCLNQATAILPATPPRILTTPAQKSSAKFPIQEFRPRVIPVPKIK